ncbi:ABC transporter ATP-binding protein (plasmid) [Aminobacter sp. BA135]|uniref:ABC transporter ATP-binding protein n=1 Tax=Aminobacter sp. BA135 TaxID=537596 RepID=UPI003D7A5DA2
MTTETVHRSSVCGLRDVSKSFGSLKALDGVSLNIRKGELLALIGENGAGKTTAMNVLFGLVQPDSGSIEVDGQARKFSSASDAIAARFGMVHQHFQLYPELTVLENIVVGQEKADLFGMVPFAQHRDAVSKILNEFGFALDLDETVEKLPVVGRQQLEIIKMLYRGASVFILDEPTAVLTPQQALALYAMLKRLCVQGASVVVVTHKLGEVMENADRVLVMRRGKLVAERTTTQTSQAELAELMVGRKIESVAKEPSIRDDTIVKVRDLTVRSLGDKPALDRVTFDIRAGEVFGIAGVSGNGQKELADALVGLRPNAGGQFVFDGTDVARYDISERRRAGIGYIAEDRMSVALARRGTVAENLISGQEHKPEFSIAGFLRRNAIGKFARHLLDRFDIRTPSIRQAVGSLSGGNQQKVVVARELSASPRFLVVENPCWGVDVGAIEAIHRQILKLAATGCAILLISSDLEELFALSDRVGVMFDGNLTRVFDREELDSFAVGAAMSGQSG